MTNRPAPAAPTPKCGCTCHPVDDYDGLACEKADCSGCGCRHMTGRAPTPKLATCGTCGTPIEKAYCPDHPIPKEARAEECVCDPLRVEWTGPCPVHSRPPVREDAGSTMPCEHHRAWCTHPDHKHGREDAGETVVLHRALTGGHGFIVGMDDRWEECPGPQYHATCDDHTYEHRTARLLP